MSLTTRGRAQPHAHRGGQEGDVGGGAEQGPQAPPPAHIKGGVRRHGSDDHVGIPASLDRRTIYLSFILYVRGEEIGEERRTEERTCSPGSDVDQQLVSGVPVLPGGVGHRGGRGEV